jgi:putative addiction module killer protein
LTDTVTPKQVIVYADDNGREPFTEWLNNLRDSAGRKRILARLFRLEQGNYGDCKPVGEGVRELRMFFGSGYRVYFGEHENDIVVLLCGGDKGSQDDDIQQAKVYWSNTLNRINRDT